MIILKQKCLHDEIMEDTICHEEAKIPQKLQHELSSSF